MAVIYWSFRAECLRRGTGRPFITYSALGFLSAATRFPLGHAEQVLVNAAAEYAAFDF